CLSYFFFFFFFFQAEDGIRDFHVTGVQTCALPILPHHPEDIVLTRSDYLAMPRQYGALIGLVQGMLMMRHMMFVGYSLQDEDFRSEERRVGKECRSRWWRYH